MQVNNWLDSEIQNKEDYQAPLIENTCSVVWILAALSCDYHTVSNEQWNPVQSDATTQRV